MYKGPKGPTDYNLSVRPHRFLCNCPELNSFSFVKMCAGWPPRPDLQPKVRVGDIFGALLADFNQLVASLHGA